MKMIKWKSSLVATLIIMLTLQVCISFTLAETDLTKPFDDTGEFLFPQIEEYFHEENARYFITHSNYSSLSEISKAYPDSSTPWAQVNLEGFDPVFYWRGSNNYAVIDDSFAEYNGLLYAGTDNPNYGPEIWAYNGDGSTAWTKVSDMPSGYSFLYGGEATQFLIVFQNYLYAGTVYGQNAPLKENGQLWRANNPVDGNSWTKVLDYDDWLVNPAGGDKGDLMSAVVYDGILYVSARAIEAGKEHPEIFRSSDGVSWTKVVDKGFNTVTDRFAYPLEVFDGKLYVSVRNDIDGTGIWRSSDGQNWEQVNIDGMAADMYQRDRDMIRQLIVYNGYLYATIRNDHLGIGNWWIEIWRSQNGTDWTQVGGNGLGDTYNNNDARGVEVYNGCLYIGTGEYMSKSARVYRTCDGINYFEFTNNQLGDANNHGVMDLQTYNGYLYAATYRYNGGIGGTEVWRYSESGIDTDGDGLSDDMDNCPNKPNGSNLGTCSSTSDKPGVNCNSAADCVIGCSINGLCIKDQRDSDEDGFGDVCDYCAGNGAADADNDGYCDLEDNCPNNCNANQLDADGDAIGDVCDTNPGCGGCGLPQCEQQCT